MGVVGRKIQLLPPRQRQKDDAKKPMLLTTVGMTALGYLHDLNMPTRLDDAGITYKRLLEQLQAHFGAKTTQLAARHEFGRLSQKKSQSIDDYAASLRTASVQCGFGADLDVRLRDQLLLGLKSEVIRKRIMERDGISFADALKLASDLERITREANLGFKAEASVSMVRNSSSKNTTSCPTSNKKFTSKPTRNYTSSSSAGFSERRQQQTTRKPGAYVGAAVLLGTSAPTASTSLTGTSVTSAATLATRLQCAHVEVNRLEEEVLHSSRMERIVVCTLLQPKLPEYIA